MQWIKDEYGSFGFFVLLAGIFSNMITFGMLCFPSEMEINSKHKRSLSVSTSKGKCSIMLRYLSVLKNKGILFYSLAMFNYCLSVYLMYLYFPHFIVQKGFTSAQAAFFLSISGIFSIVGRVTTGAIANFRCVNDIVLYSVSIAIVGINSIIYPFIATHYAGQVAYFVLLGLFMGTSFVLTTSVSLKFISAEVLATAIGLIYAFGGVGSILGPVLAG
jgi:cyanate permease